MTMNARFRRAAGFTITELLIVITIAAILGAIGIPSYRAITNSARIAGEINGLLGDLLLARSEAVKQGVRSGVTVCMSSNGTTCANSGLTWQNGWIVFIDTDGDLTLDVGETLLKRQVGFTGSDTFVSDNTRVINFNREGFATMTGAATNSSTLITLHAATATTASTRCLALNSVGRMLVQKAGVGSCS